MPPTASLVRGHGHPHSWHRPVLDDVLRRSGADVPLIMLSMAYGAALLALPSAVLIALGLWWTANVVAHNFIHLPFFRSPSLNRAYSAYLTLLLGIPQSLWRARHLAHHGGRSTFARQRARIAFETLLVLAMWGTWLAIAPRWFLTVYLPGWSAGLALCQLHGHYEHARGATSHYGRIYNALFFNDGYHVEHHARPSTHWSELRSRRIAGVQASRWPAVLRWLDLEGLNTLERIVLSSAVLQRTVVALHERAIRSLLRDMGDVHTITIVGGGLFPRTAIILRRLIPHAAVTIVDAEAAHLERARSFLGAAVNLRRELFDPRSALDVDLLVIPLAYVGDRRLAYGAPGARAVLVHDWIWSVRGRSAVVSRLLLKRVNLVRPGSAAGRSPDR